MATPIAKRCRRRVAALDWEEIGAALDASGFARIPGFLTDAECRRLSASYSDDARFRARIVMEQHRFGRGEYKYFDYPLPPLVAHLRSALYPRLARIANSWARTLGLPGRYPPSHRRLIAECRASGQSRPTPLLLRYGAGDYNRLHQDLYGKVAFPLQVTCQLSRPGRDFEGGEFLLVEQQPRMQLRAEVIALRQGEAIAFPTQLRPVTGKRGSARARMRHGVSSIRAGTRTTLGIIFHDAR
jgi:hypothetical protein